MNMNPLIKRTTEKVIGREIRPEDMSIAVIIGNAILEAIEASHYNPNYNLKGGMDVDENTIGNFKYKQQNNEQKRTNTKALRSLAQGRNNAKKDSQ